MLELMPKGGARGPDPPPGLLHPRGISFLPKPKLPAGALLDREGTGIMRGHLHLFGHPQALQRAASRPCWMCRGPALCPGLRQTLTTN